GYAMNDYVGKSGLEQNLEELLKGKKGERKITFTDGNPNEGEIVTESEPGRTIKLTVKNDFQRDIQSVLETHIQNLKSSNPSKFNQTDCGALVVLDVKTGAVLALATTPTYLLTDYADKYDELLVREGNPLVNRATDGAYRPGSTFKPVTATAGLCENFINKNTSFVCHRNYNYLGTVVHCTGYHNSIAVSRAITVSCNIFFYELGRRMGIDVISNYASHYGFGQSLGLESGDSSGYIANPETFAKHGWEWNSGLTLQAAIGQSEIAATPLQMATEALTIANRGTRLKPHLVDTVYDYNMTEVISKKEPEIAEVIEVPYEEVYDYIWDGMKGAARNTPAGEFSLNGLGYEVAIKTGTPQSSHKNGENSAVIGFAPVNDPQIAVAGIIEGGANAKYMVRKVLDAYTNRYGGFQPSE
ncbi:MAG: hypothetical protein LBL93_07200, partial [Ruminococcus sp.]|nr:hypothetical protein [Ruminococcus sp.]